MKYKIGVMGKAGRSKGLPEKIIKAAESIGREIVKQNCVLVTGACMGVADIAAKAASKQGGLIFGYSPAKNLREHLEPPISYPYPAKNIEIIFTGQGKIGRNVLSIVGCDGVIFVGGGIGTLNEFSTVYHEGKVIGVLEGVEGIIEKIMGLEKDLKSGTAKAFEAVIIKDKNPKKLVERVIEEIKNRKAKYRKMVVFVTPFASEREGMKDLLVLLGKKKEAIKVEQEYQKRKLLGPWTEGIEKIAKHLQESAIDLLIEATSYYCERNLLTGIGEFSQALREQNFLVGAVTSDPQFMMDVVKKEARLDFAYGTELEFESKIATGNVLKKLDRYDKAKLVEEKAKEFNIPKEKIITMGEASIVHLPIAEKSHIFIGFDPVKDDLINAIRKNKKLSSIL